MSLPYDMSAYVCAYVWVCKGGLCDNVLWIFMCLCVCMCVIFTTISTVCSNVVCHKISRCKDSQLHLVWCAIILY